MCGFRASGKDVQIWRPMDGAMTKWRGDGWVATLRAMPDRSGNRQPGIEPAAYVRRSRASPTVSLDLAERESVFVVFRNAAAAPARTASAPSGDEAGDARAGRGR